VLNGAGYVGITCVSRQRYAVVDRDMVTAPAR